MATSYCFWRYLTETRDGLVDPQHFTTKRFYYHFGKRKKTTNFKSAFMQNVRFYADLSFFVGLWSASLSEHFFPTALPLTSMSFRSWSCSCVAMLIAHKHSSSLWGVQSCSGSTEGREAIQKLFGKALLHNTTIQIYNKGIKTAH